MLINLAHGLGEESTTLCLSLAACAFTTKKNKKDKNDADKGDKGDKESDKDKKETEKMEIDE
jgi:hypothetical protein